MRNDFESRETIQTTQGTFKLHFIFEFGRLICRFRQTTIKIFNEIDYKVGEHYVDSIKRSNFEVVFHEPLRPSAFEDLGNEMTTIQRKSFTLHQTYIEADKTYNEAAWSEDNNMISIENYVKYQKEKLKSKIISMMSYQNILKVEEDSE